jgi:hypothetical protein
LPQASVTELSYELRVRDQLRAAEERRKKRQAAEYEKARTKSAERGRMRETEAEFARQLTEYEGAADSRYVPPLQKCPPKTLFARPSGLTDKQWKRMREKANKRAQKTD